MLYLSKCKSSLFALCLYSIISYLTPASSTYLLAPHEDWPSAWDPNDPDEQSVKPDYYGPMYDWRKRDLLKLFKRLSTINPIDGNILQNSKKAYTRDPQNRQAYSFLRG
ncbi:hypothetical protein FBUS_00524 [Fasciolopsis buskii]|uniref:Uncharacterized protein n=1 Tax=Fasciolopsis buskii TaxID=27845 RepID=A0A8E0VPM8_9TREM|nr:hypothetical protein FBUS_00524 [Fasciolopsis buski]